MEQFQIQDFIITYNDINDPKQIIEKRVNRAILLFYLVKLTEDKIGSGVSTFNMSDNVSNEAKEVFIDAAQGKQVCFDSHIAYQLNYLCNIYGNEVLKSKIAEFIQKIPRLHSTILRTIFKVVYSKEDFSKEVNEIAEYFAESIKIIDLYQIDANFLIDHILNNPKFQKGSPENQHAIISYIKYALKSQNTPDENNGIKAMNELLKGVVKKFIKFEEISASDIFDLKLLFNDDNNPDNNLLNEAQLKRITALDEILADGNKDLKKLETDTEKLKTEMAKESGLIKESIKNAEEKIEEAKYMEDPQTNQKILKIEYEQKRLSEVRDQESETEKKYSFMKENLEKLADNIKKISQEVEKVQILCDELK